MPRVAFTQNLLRHVACPTMDVEASSIREALDAVCTQNPALRSYILDDQDRLRKHVAVFLNGTMIPNRERTKLGVPVSNSDEIFVFQALSGG